MFPMIHVSQEIGHLIMEQLASGVKAWSGGDSSPLMAMLFEPSSARSTADMRYDSSDKLFEDSFTSVLNKAYATEATVEQETGAPPGSDVDPPRQRQREAPATRKEVAKQEPNAPSQRPDPSEKRKPSDNKSDSMAEQGSQPKSASKTALSDAANLAPDSATILLLATPEKPSIVPVNGGLSVRTATIPTNKKSASVPVVSMLDAASNLTIGPPLSPVDKTEIANSAKVAIGNDSSRAVKQSAIPGAGTAQFVELAPSDVAMLSLNASVSQMLGSSASAIELHVKGGTPAGTSSLQPKQGPDAILGTAKLDESIKISVSSPSALTPVDGLGNADSLKVTSVTGAAQPPNQSGIPGADTTHSISNPGSRSVGSARTGVPDSQSLTGNVLPDSIVSSNGESQVNKVAEPSRTGAQVAVLANQTTFARPSGHIATAESLEPVGSLAPDGQSQSGGQASKDQPSLSDKSMGQLSSIQKDLLPASEFSAEAQISTPTGITPGASKTSATDTGLSVANRELVIRQVADRIELLAAARSNNGVVIHLEPRDLGSITLVIKNQGESVNAQLYASHDHVRTALQQGRAQLGQSLEQRGIQLASVSVGSQSDFKQGGSGQTPAQPESQPKPAFASSNSQSKQASTQELRSLESVRNVRRTVGMDLWI